MGSKNSAGAAKGQPIRARNKASSMAEKVAGAPLSLSFSDADEARKREAYIQLYEAGAVIALLEKLDTKLMDKKSRGQVAARLRSMPINRERRKLATLDPTWSFQLDQLAERYVNFQSVINFVRAECLLASISRIPAVKLPPILLLGDAGIGKTEFAKRLAPIIGGGFFQVQMENAQGGAALCGTAQHYLNSKTGKVFDALVDNASPNPLF